MLHGIAQLQKILLVVLLVFLLAGFRLFGKHVDNYFPLEEGLSLEYGFARKKGEETLIKATVTVTNMSPKIIENKNVVPRKYEIKDDKNVTHSYYAFFLNDKEGIIFYATQVEKDNKPKVFPHSFYYLKNPIKIGTTWGGGESPKGTIESISETVTVPAGTFENCVKVKITYPQSMPMNESVYWFAEKTGIVKSSYLYKDSAREHFELTSIKQ